jgi:hypothetical protein
VWCESRREIAIEIVVPCFPFATARMIASLRPKPSKEKNELFCALKPPLRAMRSVAGTRTPGAIQVSLD